MSDTITQRDLENESRLVRIEEKVDGLARHVDERFGDLGNRIDDVVVTQVKDHGKRIAALERHQSWFAGWVAGAAGVASCVTAFLVKVLQ